ncbi:MAG TPA: DUF2914 domain-containing protein [Nitrospirota bacterium]|nr:DUF2914 domain-containing protein [Nitrospirota bacterium]
MKKAFIGILVFIMLFATGIVLADETPAPSPTPEPAAPAAPAAPAEPATPAPVPAAKAPAPEAPGLNIARMEIAGSVEDREPVGIAATFPDNTDKVYCFVEVKDAPMDTSITFVWTLGPNEMGKVTQQVKQSSRWRTWTSKTVSGMRGDWKVDVLDESGAVLKSATFKVE